MKNRTRAYFFAGLAVVLVAFPACLIASYVYGNDTVAMLGLVASAAGAYAMLRSATLRGEEKWRANNPRAAKLQDIEKADERNQSIQYRAAAGAYRVMIPGCWLMLLVLSAFGLITTPGVCVVIVCVLAASSYRDYLNKKLEREM